MFEGAQARVAGSLGPGLYPGLIQGGEAMETRAPAAGSLPEVVSEQERLLSALTQELTDLENRVSPFARPVPPSGQVQGGNTPQPIMSPLAECIARHNSRLVVLIDSARALVRRIDG